LHLEEGERGREGEGGGETESDYFTMKNFIKIDIVPVFA